MPQGTKIYIARYTAMALTTAIISHASKEMLKILQARLQHYVNHELPDVQAGFRKGRGTIDQIANICWIIKKATGFQKNMYFCFIDYAKAFDYMNHNKLWKILKEMGIWDHLTCLLRRRQWQPTAVLLPGKSHWWRSLVGCSPWGYEESDVTEWLHFHFSLSCIGKWNGNPLQCSCLENPRDEEAWWAAIYGTAQSQRLKQLSSSSSRPASWDITIQVRKEQWELDMEQQTGSK